VKPNLNTFAPGSVIRPGTKEDLPSYSKGAGIIVIGAGAFGGWSALYLLRKGFKVTLIDAWGPGNSRSSSGDETRVIRSTYGDNETYFDLNVRSLSLWKENQALFQKQLFYNTGVLWFCYEDKTPLVDDSLIFAQKHAMPYERLTVAEMRERFPAVSTAGLSHAYYDPYGGYLLARESARYVRDAFVKEGGNYLQQQVRPPDEHSAEGITLANGDRLRADAYLFACGSWLGEMFPAVLGKYITCTKQEVYYFGTPPGDRVSTENLPVWVDVDGKNFYYGIPGNAHRGFKIGVDLRGDTFDPTHDDRILTPESLQKARAFIGYRFPMLRDAPLLEHRVCPYENSPDGNFIFDVCPGTDNIILLGGGSGHGFKHGPALGELVANVLAGESSIPELFRLR